MANNENDGQRLTWCGNQKCTEIVDLDTNPANDRNGEALCPEHGQRG